MKTETQSQKTVMLPKEAHIIVEPMFEIIVENHKVVSFAGFYIASKNLCGTNMWDYMLKQMKQQGITYEAFQQQCITEIEEIIDGSVGYNWGVDKTDFKKVMSIILRKIQGCTSWENYNKAMDVDGKFRKEKHNMILKMREEYLTRNIARNQRKGKKINKKQKKGGNKS